MPGPDRRRGTRFRAPCILRLAGEPAPARDVSASGAYVLTARRLEPGSTVDVVLEFRHRRPDSPRRARCRGTVVRIERHEAGYGVALAFSAWELEEGAS